MNKIKKAWSNIFGISSSEFSGYRLLVFTAIICWLGLALANHLTKKPYDNYEKDTELLDSLLAIIEENKIVEPIKNVKIRKIEFDPNTVSFTALIQMGFPDWLSTRLINYRKAGARFNEPKDLLKLYNFPDSLYVSVAEYVKIEPLELPKAHVKKTSSKKKVKDLYVETALPIFDLNTADTAVFQTIKGIGTKLSRRIVEYRASLGGFVKKEQLYQVYGLDSIVVEKLLEKSLIVDNFIPSKIDINTSSKEQLAAHPYISWNQAKLIIAYRNQHGDFKSKQELLRVYAINDNWIKKVAPYLTF